MGMREAFQKAAVTAFNAIGNVKESVTYRSKTANPDYTPASGVIADPYTDYSVSMVFTSVKSEEVDGQAIQINDLWALIPGMNLTPTPKFGDIIVKSSINWKVIAIKTDPTEALWKFLIRHG